MSSEAQTDAHLRASLERCARIIAGFEDIEPILRDVLPAFGQDLANLDLVQRIASVALLKRYEQLQDMIARLARAVASWELEDVSHMTRRDFANWLEKLGLVVTADNWVEATLLRNRLAHEYPLAETEQVERVNECWRGMPELIAMVATVHAYLAARDYDFAG